MVCRSGSYDRNNKLQPVILYPSSGNIDEIILARAMGFSWDYETSDTDTARPHIKVGHFSLIFLSDKLVVDQKPTVL